MAGQLNLETYVGDVLSAPLQFATDRTGATPIDLTGKTYQALVLTSSGSTAATMTVTVATPANGQMTLSLTDTQVSTLGAGSHRWCLRDTTADVTVLVGTLTILTVV
jgi:hypothetical protein